MLTALRRSFQVFLAIVFCAAGAALGGYGEAVLWLMGAASIVLAFS
jgi:hypothetical protein